MIVACETVAGTPRQGRGKKMIVRAGYEASHYHMPGSREEDDA
jgi:hypothetical protein